MVGENLSKKPLWVLGVAIFVFVGFIFIALKIGVKDYINDSLFLLFLCVVLYWGYNALFLKEWIYLLIVGAFGLHNLGVFGFYNVSPVFLQWDHITHFFGEFAAGVFVYNYVYSAGIFNLKNVKKFGIICLVILAALGIGVFVEFIEFYGYFFVGDGLGVFGHGKGDINTEFINNEWFNTMLDLIYNFVGVLFAVFFCKYVLKNKYMRKPV